jgi:hypothetical protein
MPSWVPHAHVASAAGLRAYTPRSSHLRRAAEGGRPIGGPGWSRSEPQACYRAGDERVGSLTRSWVLQEILGQVI